jgi:group I intron endonuclease
LSKSKKICGIYSITLTLNGRQYIGSSVDIKERWRRHKKDLRKNKHHSIQLQRCWNKYNEDDFIFEIIEECDAIKETILEREQFYIDSINPVFNSCKLAGSPLGSRRTKEQIDKMSKISQDRWNDKEYRDKMIILFNSEEIKSKQSESAKKTSKERSERMIDFNKQFWTDEQKERQSKIRKEYTNRPEIRKKMSDDRKGDKSQNYGKTGELNNLSKSYLIFFPNGNVEKITGIKEFCRRNGLRDGAMCKVAKGKANHCSGFKCETYVDGKYTEDELLEKGNEWSEWWNGYKENGRKGSNSNRAKKYVVTTPECEHVFVYSMKQFCINNGLIATCMSNVANGKQKSHRGYTAQHYNEEIHSELLLNQQEQLKAA